MTTSAVRSFTGVEARRLIRRARLGFLGTIERDGGFPYVSLVTLATDYAGEPLFLISRLARHSRNLEADRRASLLIAEPAAEGDPLTGPRATVIGRAERLDDPDLLDRYVRLNPQAEGYVAFADFSLWRLRAETVHAVAGFGRIEMMAAGEVFLDGEALGGFAGLERDAIAHLNADHAQALARCATKLLGAQDGDWRATAIDPDGAVLRLGNQSRRLEFEETARDGSALRSIFMRLDPNRRDRAPDRPSSSDDVTPAKPMRAS